MSLASTPDPGPPRMLLQAYPAYGKFWCARIVAGMAFQIQAVAVGWQVYDLTHSTFQLGIVGLVQFLPIILCTLPAGHAADHFDRRLVYRVTLGLQALAAGLLALESWGHWIGLTGIYVLVGIIGACRAFQSPASQSLLPALVPLSVLPKAIAWSTGALQTAFIVGPAVGGLLYAFGPAVPYATAAALALAGVVFVSLMGPTGTDRPRPAATFASLFSGIHFIRGHSVILGSISLDLFAVLFGGATALLPVFARDILHIGVWGLGALRSAPAVGSLAMSVYLARHPPRREVGKKMFYAVMVFGLATALFGLSRSLFLSLGTLVILGAADTISVVIRSSLVQLETPDEMRGRVGAVNSLFVGTSNQLGEFESGVTAALIGTVPATVLGGVGTLIIALSWMRLFPALRNFDRFDRKPGP